MVGLASREQHARIFVEQVKSSLLVRELYHPVVSGREFRSPDLNRTVGIGRNKVRRSFADQLFSKLLSGSAEVSQQTSGSELYQHSILNHSPDLFGVSLENSVAFRVGDYRNQSQVLKSAQYLIDIVRVGPKGRFCKDEACV